MYPLTTLTLVLIFCDELYPRPTSGKKTEPFDFIHEGGAFSSWINLLSLVQQTSIKETKFYHPSFCGQRPGLSAAAADRRIVGGSTARQGEVPWHASLVRLSSKPSATRVNIKCGAALISSKAALTAAHCIKLDPSKYQVIVGKETSRTTEECSQQILNVVSYIKHPDFNPRTLKTDIAILKLESKYGQGVMFTKWVLPACLSQSKSFYTPGTDGLVSGFGLLSESSTKVSDKLQVVSLSVLDQDSCEASYSKLTKIGSSQYCAGGKSGQVRDACAGDSGGPMAVLQDGRWILSGIVSFGVGCGRPSFPGVYTKVEPFISWIVDNVPIEDDDHKENVNNYLERSTNEYQKSSQHSVEGMCQGTQRTIWCDHESVIQISEEEVFYGRLTTDYSNCPITRPTRYRYNCSLSSAASDLSSSCTGTTRCRVSMDTFSFNPCPELEPFVSFQFECVDVMGRSYVGGSHP